MAHDLMPIRSQSEKHRKLHTLINRVDVAHLLMAHDKQSVRKAVGVDGITKMEYEANLVENLRDLVSRMKHSSTSPSRSNGYTSKANGKLRPLGLPSYEDKLVQSVMADILSDVYEHASSTAHMDSAQGVAHTMSSVALTTRSCETESTGYLMPTLRLLR